MPTSANSTRTLQTTLFDSTPQPRAEGQKIVLPVLQCGHIVSFKNSKMILPGKVAPNGEKIRRAMLITKPEYQKLLKEYEAAIERALLSAYRIAVAGMQTAPSLQSWIVSSVFLDDSVDWIPESDGYVVERVDPGHEGIVIEITRLP
jgi:hypothetical protein